MKEKTVVKIHISVLLMAFFFLNSSVLPNLEEKFCQNIVSIEKDNDLPVNLFDPNTSQFESGLLQDCIQTPITIKETAVFHKTESFHIGNGSESDLNSKNATYPLDTTHSWQANEIDVKISNIIDTRNWIENYDFGSNSEFEPTKKEQVFDSGPNYPKNSNPNTIRDTYYVSSDFVRIHFVNITFESGFDYLYIKNQDNSILKNMTGTFEDYTTEWYSATEIRFTISSDNSVELYGYYIDYFEEYNQTSQEIASSNWTFYKEPIGSSFPSGEINNFLNNSAMKVQINGSPQTDDRYTYTGGSTAGFNQSLIIPRGELKDAWVSFDYYLENGINTNDMFIFMELNEHLIYTRGFRTIRESGFRTWRSSGLINQILWENASTIFTNSLKEMELGIKIGIRVSSSVTYSGFDDRDKQKVFLDNIQLVLSTEANSSQNLVNLTIDHENFVDLNEAGWGFSTYNKIDLWVSNPIVLTLRTDAPNLQFDMETIVYASHSTETRTYQHGDYGTRLNILPDGTIKWDFYHNVFIPQYYENYSFQIDKPYGWNITDVRDPTGLSIPFEYGQMLDNKININEIYAQFTGWWYFSAVSCNLVYQPETFLWNKTTWVPFAETTLNTVIYDVNDILSLKTRIFHPESIPLAVDLTLVNLTIYNPTNSIWWSESLYPEPSGNADFTNITIGAFNTTAGIYSYSIVWTNGTCAGGLNGSFEIRHNLECQLLYPRDASEDLISEKIFGDILAIRIRCNDSNNGQLISNINIQYNWTDGIHILTEISTGIYDGSLDTLDLLSEGIFYIQFNLSRAGFYNISITLELRVIKECDLQIIQLENYIELGTNFTMMLSYTSKLGGIGIENAHIELNISTSEYFITQKPTIGQYLVNISTASLTTGGYLSIIINASKTNFESKTLFQQIQIAPRNVYFEIAINSADCSLNKSYSTKIHSPLNLETQIFTKSDDQQVTDGTILLTDNQGFSRVFVYNSGKYNLSFNADVLGLGTHYLSLIFNKSNYQTTAITIQLSVGQLELTAIFSNLETATIIAAPDSEFEVIIYLEDPSTKQFLIGAKVSYSWQFGTGLLEELGNGEYRLMEKTPSQQGTYKIKIVIDAGNTYQVETIELILISNIPATEEPRPDYTWAIVVGVLLLVGLLGIVVKQNIINPRRLRALEELRKSTQVFDDVFNIRGVMIIQKSSGLLLYNHIIGDPNSYNQTIFSGFLQAIMLFSTQLTPDSADYISRGDRSKVDSHSGMAKGADFLEFTHQNFNIFVKDGENIRVALILDGRSSTSLREKTDQLIEQFEIVFGDIIVSWDGNQEMFIQTGYKMIEDIFELVLLKDYTLSDKSSAQELIKELITPNSLSETVYNILKTLTNEQTMFKLRTVVSLISASNQLKTKGLLLQFIQKRIIAHPNQKLMDIMTQTEKTAKIESQINELENIKE